MTRHQSYSKRSRESRKAMNDDTADDDDYPDCCERIAAEDWSPLADELNWPPDPVS
ncbi:hypothetical protein NM962_11285 [Mycobacterium sp. SVM_VP21]|nr:hypothetical protein NM962_11285 [Mycobacterium sp. SVM_VP21]